MFKINVGWFKKPQPEPEKPQEVSEIDRLLTGILQTGRIQRKHSIDPEGAINEAVKRSLDQHTPLIVIILDDNHKKNGTVFVNNAPPPLAAMLLRDAARALSK